MRFFIRFSYFGANYHGWQNQPNAISVQEVLEEAISTLIRQKIKLTGAGRTDAGVHAKQMIAHFDLEEMPREDLVKRLNAFLPSAIAVQEIFEVAEDAHARFDATERTYEYWVVVDKNPFHEGSAYYVSAPLDVAAMNAAAKLLLTHTDFQCFSKSGTDVKTFDCDITKATWDRTGEILRFTITANRFLRNMVRAIVGTLLEVGVGKLDTNQILAILESKNRSKAGMSVPAKGLYLTQIKYPKKQ